MAPRDARLYQYVGGEVLKAAISSLATEVRALLARWESAAVRAASPPCLLHTAVSRQAAGAVPRCRTRHGPLTHPNTPTRIHIPHVLA